MGDNNKYTHPITGNDAIILMYKNTSSALNNIADHIEKHQLSTEEIISLLRELSAEQLAQVSVCEIREMLYKNNL